MEKQKEQSLLSCLVNDDESARVVAVAELVNHSERYIRSVSLLLSALAFKVQEEEVSRDILAARDSIDEITSWFSTHRENLLSHIKAVQPPASTAHH